MTIRVGSKVARSTEAIWTTVGEDLVMFDPERGKYFCLNAMGSAIWERLAGDVQVSDLCDALMAEFEVTADECRDDVLAFVNMLVSRGLARVVEVG